MATERAWEPAVIHSLGGGGVEVPGEGAGFRELKRGNTGVQSEGAVSAQCFNYRPVNIKCPSHCPKKGTVKYKRKPKKKNSSSWQVPARKDSEEPKNM